MKKAIIAVLTFYAAVFAYAASTIPLTQVDWDVADSVPGERIRWRMTRGGARYFGVRYLQNAEPVDFSDASETNITMIAKASNSTNVYEFFGSILDPATGGVVRVLWPSTSAPPAAVYQVWFRVPADPNLNLAAQGKLKLVESTGDGVSTSPPIFATGVNRIIAGAGMVVDPPAGRGTVEISSTTPDPTLASVMTNGNTAGTNLLMSGFGVSNASYYALAPGGHIQHGDQVQTFGVKSGIPYQIITNLDQYFTPVAGGSPVDSGREVTNRINMAGNWLSGNAADRGIFIKDDGDVGIGTNSPQARLHVTDSAGAADAPVAGTVAMFTRTLGADDVCYLNLQGGSGAAARSGVTFGDLNRDDEVRIHYLPVEDQLRLVANNGDRLTVGQFGNICVGFTNPPSAKFSVVPVDVPNASVSANGIGIESTSTNPELSFLCANTESGEINFGDPENASSGYIAYDHGNSYFRFDIEQQPQVFWGTSEFVFNEQSLARDFRVETLGRAAALFVEGSTGHIGANTNNPATWLNVNGVSDGRMMILETDSASTENNILIKNNGDGDASIAFSCFKAPFSIWQMGVDHTDGHLKFGTSQDNVGGFTKAVLTAQGRLGVGTNEPLCRVHAANSLGPTDPVGSDTVACFSHTQTTTTDAFVNAQAGTSGISGFTLGDSDRDDKAAVRYDHSAEKLHLRTEDTDRLTVLLGGNVGVGEDTPATKLHVAGGITLTERSEPGNPADGQAVLWFSNGTGTGADGDLMFKRTVGGSTTTYRVDLTAL